MPDVVVRFAIGVLLVSLRSMCDRDLEEVHGATRRELERRELEASPWLVEAGLVERHAQWH
jgi:hypothetical protein